MTILAGGAYACLRAAVSTQAMVEERMDSLQSARAILKIISEDLRMAIPMQGESEFLGLDRAVGGTEGDNLDFATRNYSYQRPGEADFAEVSYFVSPAAVEGEMRLMRRRDPTPDLLPLEGGQVEMIAEGLKGIRFEYYDGIEWFDDWGSTDQIKPDEDSLLAPGNLYGMPSAVRITISVGKPSNPPIESQAPAPGKLTNKGEPPSILQTTVFIHSSTLIEPTEFSSESEI